MKQLSAAIVQRAVKHRPAVAPKSPYAALNGICNDIGHLGSLLLEPDSRNRTLTELPYW